jgi:hypothetical protein
MVSQGKKAASLKGGPCYKKVDGDPFLAQRLPYYATNVQFLDD